MSTEIEIDEGLLNAFLDESTELLDGLDQLFVRLETEPKNLDVINAIFRPVHSIKGNAPFFGYTKLRTLAHEIESVLAAVRENKLVVNKDHISVLLAGVDELRHMLQRAKQAQPEVLDGASFDALVKSVSALLTNKDTSSDHIIRDVHETLKQLLLLDPNQVKQKIESLIQTLAPLARPTVSDKSASKDAPSKGAAAASADTTSSKAIDSHKSMRVSEEHIDTFLAYVGELLIIGEMLSYLEKRIVAQLGENSMIIEFKRLNEAFTKLSHDLQKSIMSIRKVPVKSLLQKVPRLVRDIATHHGKDIEVKISGEEVELDKSLIELLDAPLTHMVRNAADHGIELPNDRIAKSKPKTGTISVSVQESEAHTALIIEDDGAGLNFDAIGKKAESMGLISPGKVLTHKDIVNFIFAAGVSTAKQVTDVSGRGVGMDVVKKKVEEAGGKIVVDSTTGKGSRFKIEIPKTVTTQIMEGLMIDVGGHCFAIPLERVNEAFCCKQSDIKTFSAKKGEFLSRHDRVIPILPIHTLMGQELSTEPKPFELMVSVIANKQLVSIRIDDVLGLQKIVLKKIDGLSVNGEYFVGGALMGDGRVALVVDLDKICAGFIELPSDDDYQALAH